MDAEEMKSLQPGDMVKHALFNEVYVVTGNYGDRVTAVKTVDITNPPEWEVVKRPRKRATALK
jgi:hypothetical protein